MELVDVLREVETGRTLLDGKCKCGVYCKQWLNPGESLSCQTCRDKASRARNGWTPGNSVD
jgi:hypothetical protein